MKLAHHSMTEIRRAVLLASLESPTTAPEMAGKTGRNAKHLYRTFRVLEASGEVVEAGRIGRGNAVLWRRV